MPVSLLQVALRVVFAATFHAQLLPLAFRAHRFPCAAAAGVALLPDVTGGERALRWLTETLRPWPCSLERLAAPFTVKRE
jgi:hypothetical protein